MTHESCVCARGRGVLKVLYPKYYKHLAYVLTHEMGIKSWVILFTSQGAHLLSVQMAVLSSSFSVFVVLGIYNFGGAMDTKKRRNMGKKHTG